MQFLNRTILLLALVTLFSACENDSDRDAAALTFPVTVEKIKRGYIAEYISATGTLRAVREERVFAEVEGLLKLTQKNGATLAAGSKVQKGYLLSTIENREYELSIRVESQELAMENAERELKKQEALFKEGGVTEKELELSRRNALDAKFNYESAVIKQAKLRLKAPITGHIASLQSSSNNTRVRAGFALCTIMDYSSTLVDVQIPNADLGKIKHGQKVIVTNYALPDDSFEGLVSAIDPTIDERTRTFTVTIAIDNKKLQLRPGMFIKTDIVVASKDDAVIIPKSAIQTRKNQPVVFVVEETSAVEREIVTGIETREDIEIREGVVENEQLIIRGMETLQNKSKVRITK